MQPIPPVSKKRNTQLIKLSMNTVDFSRRRKKTTSLSSKALDASMPLHESTEIMPSFQLDAPPHRCDFSITQFSNQLGKQLREINKCHNPVINVLNERDKSQNNQMQGE